MRSGWPISSVMLPILLCLALQSATAVSREYPGSEGAISAVPNPTTPAPVGFETVTKFAAQKRTSDTASTGLETPRVMRRDSVDTHSHISRSASKDDAKSSKLVARDEEYALHDEEELPNGSKRTTSCQKGRQRLFVPLSPTQADKITDKVCKYAGGQFYSASRVNQKGNTVKIEKLEQSIEDLKRYTFNWEIVAGAAVLEEEGDRQEEDFTMVEQMCKEQFENIFRKCTKYGTFDGLGATRLEFGKNNNNKLWFEIRFFQKQD
ncbi:hypothetical protein BJ508DRAFT_327301 [Ascobolus immersus RN42]|uniref:Uncharacterized protein n=1 Tax=Ascobolus immersus RN42 TaxID=1160509 RepID=A0A3N4I2R1_ASCIM|nr:hypothetical protein BJ508DRAFT_327301 [Ascobolus immersus RN42]